MFFSEGNFREETALEKHLIAAGSCLFALVAFFSILYGLAGLSNVIDERQQQEAQPPAPLTETFNV